MQKKIIAVLTEEDDLNIHAVDINHIELTMKERKIDDESIVITDILSKLYYANSIQ
ncbi:MAG: hypothetical protein WCW64_06680 [Phycisphaerae bacterium]|jgi:hypothetical protein